MLYRTAGQEGKGITFIFTDQDVKEEGFLEYINNVLSSGVVSYLWRKNFSNRTSVSLSKLSNFKVAGLFARDETEDICNDLVPIMKKEFPKKTRQAKICMNSFCQDRGKYSEVFKIKSFYWNYYRINIMQTGIIYILFFAFHR